MALVARWAAIWSPPLSRGSVEVWDECLVFDGWSGPGERWARFNWSDVAAVRRATSSERLKGLPTIVLEIVDGQEIEVAPLECGVLTVLQRIADAHAHETQIAAR